MPPEEIEEINDKEKKPKRKRKRLLIFLVVLPAVLLLVALGLYFGTGMNASSAEGSEREIEYKDIKKVTIDSFTVNLADEGYMRYLRTTITLETTSKEVEKEIQAKMHRIKNIILGNLRGKKVVDLDTPEETRSLREQLLKAINEELTSGEVLGLYFEEFIIQ